MAWRVLVGLQDSGWVNVLQRAAERGTDEAVRAEARRLLAKWERERAKRDKK